MDVATRLNMRSRLYYRHQDENDGDGEEPLEVAIRKCLLRESNHRPTWRSLLEILREFGKEDLSQRIEMYLQGKRN